MPVGRTMLTPLHEVDESCASAPLLAHNNPVLGALGRRSTSGAGPCSTPMSCHSPGALPSPSGTHTISNPLLSTSPVCGPACASSHSCGSSYDGDEEADDGVRRPRWLDHRALFVSWLLLSLINFPVFASDVRLLVSWLGIVATICGVSVSLMSLQDGCASRPSWGDTEPVFWAGVVRAAGLIAGLADLVVMLVLDTSLLGLLSEEVDCELPDAHGVTCSDMLVSAVVDTLLLVVHGYLAVELARRAAQMRAAHTTGGGVTHVQGSCLV